jgi:hypothetical protein
LGSEVEFQVFLRQLPGDGGRQVLRSADAQLFVDIVAAEDGFDVTRRDAAEK